VADWELIFRERPLIPRYLASGESVNVMQPAWHRGSLGALVATDVRLLFIARGFVRLRPRVVSLPYYYLRGPVTIDPDPGGGVALTVDLAGTRHSFTRMGAEGAKTMALVVGQHRLAAEDSELPIGEDAFSRRWRIFAWAVTAAAVVAVVSRIGYGRYAIAFALGVGLCAYVWATTDKTD
jgi:hypothetical protein